jgi:hypothetical protein
MKLPTRLFRAKRAAPSGTQAADLSFWNGGHPAAFGLVARPNALSPTDHQHPIVDPTLADPRLAVTQLIDELAGSGALDEGTPDVLDRWIGQQLSGWEQAVNAQAEVRRIIAARLLGVDAENLKRESCELEGMQERMARLRQAQAHWRDQLHGHAFVRAPATLAEPRASLGRPTDDFIDRPAPWVSKYLHPNDPVL